MKKKQNPKFSGDDVKTTAFVLVSTAIGPNKTIVNHYLLEPDVHATEQGPCATVTTELYHAYRINYLHEAQRIRDLMRKNTKLHFTIHKINITITADEQEPDEGRTR